MEGFDLSQNFSIYRSEKYNNVYETLISKKVYTNRAEVFTLAAIVGFRKGNRKKIEKRATEMRSEHISGKELVALLTIIFKEFDNDLNKFENYDLVKEKMQIVEEYAEGGMEILCNEAFNGLWNGYVLKEDYDRYQIDLIRYLNTELKNEKNNINI